MARHAVGNRWGTRRQPLACLEGALQEQPEATALRELLIELLLARGRHDRAGELLEKLRPAEHASPRVDYLAGQLAYATGDLEQADAFFQAAAQQAEIGQRPLELIDADRLHAAGLAAGIVADWSGDSEAYRNLVQTFFPALIARRPDFWPAHLEMARLFAAKFNTPAAVTSRNKALAINASAGEIYLLRARLAIDEFNLPAAKRDIERALATNRELLDGYALLADCFLAEFQFEEAIAALEQAVAIHPHAEAIQGRLAGAYRARDGAQEGVDDSKWRGIEREALARNPHCGEFYRTMADSLDRMRKYPQAGEFYRRAEEVMPGRVGTEASLGMIAMRMGQEGKAKELLEAAFKRDPFHIRVKNSLEVLDLLSTYAVIETEHFILRFDRGQDQVMAEAAAEYLEDEIYDLLVKRLGYEPPEKSLIEVFSRGRNSTGHSWFSARMVGLPFIGTVGACAGKMAAIVSPNDGRQFHWARVLRHEFVHVVNLQQTDFNIPHWYTEGLAVWNEDRPRQPQWRAILANRHASGTLLNLDTINMGFIRPRNGTDRTLAYCQAEIYCEYMVAEYGVESLGAMLTAYRNDLTTAEALAHCFSVEQAAFEKGYGEFVTAVVKRESPQSIANDRSIEEIEAAIKDNSNNADLHAELALARLSAGKLNDAKAAAAAALKLDDTQQLAAYVIAALLVKVDRAETAREFLAKRLDPDWPEPHALWMLATLAAGAEDFAAAAEHYRLGHDKIPAARKWLTGLGQVYQKTGDQAGQLWLLTQLADSDEDNFELRKKIVTLADRLGEEAIAGRYAEDACYIDPQSPDLWALAARWHALEKRHAKAARRYRWALHFKPNMDNWRVSRIEALVHNQEFDEAVAELATLREMTPDHNDLTRLKKEIASARSDLDQ